MTADEVQRFVARCLVDPDYLDADQSALMPREQAFIGDLTARLRLFRGFITRIKHNQLRKIVPLTLRLMHLHGADIEFFSAAAPDYLRARRTGALPLPNLFERFETALSGGLHGQAPPARDQIRSVMRHESRIWRAKHTAGEEAAAAHPMLPTGSAIEAYNFDMLGFCAAIAKDQFTLPIAEMTDQMLFYHLVGPLVRVDDIDSLSAWVLQRLNGETSIEELDNALARALGVATGHAVADIVADAIGRGFVVPARRTPEAEQ